MLIALGSTPVLQYYSFMGPKIQKIQKTPSDIYSRNKCNKLQPKPTIFWAL